MSATDNTTQQDEVEIRPIFKLDGLPPDNFPMECSGSLKTFMFLCYDDEAVWNAAGPDVHMAAMQEAVTLTHELHSRGRYLSASPLHPSTTATCVRVREGRKQITDGPFAETREVLGGYYLILANDQPEAVAIAARHSGARVGSVEVRQVFELPATTEFQPDCAMSMSIELWVIRLSSASSGWCSPSNTPGGSKSLSPRLPPLTQRRTA